LIRPLDPETKDSDPLIDPSPGDRMPTGNAVRTAKETRRRAAIAPYVRQRLNRPRLKFLSRPARRCCRSRAGRRRMDETAATFAGRVAGLFRDTRPGVSVAPE